MQQAVGAQATAVRSQSYYLDVTPPGHDKGTFVEAMARRLGIPTVAIATIGDMQNDLAMFKKSGLSIAMGNATDDVKKQASHVTTSNEEEGFAGAIEFILGNNPRRHPEEPRGFDDGQEAAPQDADHFARCTTGFSTGFFASLRLCAVLISAIWVSACGKFPV